MSTDASTTVSAAPPPSTSIVSAVISTSHAVPQDDLGTQVNNGLSEKVSSLKKELDELKQEKDKLEQEKDSEIATLHDQIDQLTKKLQQVQQDKKARDQIFLALEIENKKMKVMLATATTTAAAAAVPVVTIAQEKQKKNLVSSARWSSANGNGNVRSNDIRSNSRSNSRPNSRSNSKFSPRSSPTSSPTINSRAEALKSTAPKFSQPSVTSTQDKQQKQSFQLYVPNPTLGSSQEAPTRTLPKPASKKEAPSPSPSTEKPEEKPEEKLSQQFFDNVCRTSLSPFTCRDYQCLFAMDFLEAKMKKKAGKDTKSVALIDNVLKLLKMNASIAFSSSSNDDEDVLNVLALVLALVEKRFLLDSLKPLHAAAVSHIAQKIQLSEEKTKMAIVSYTKSKVIWDNKFSFSL